VIGIQRQQPTGPWQCVLLLGGHEWKWREDLRMYRCGICGKEKTG